MSPKFQQRHYEAIAQAIKEVREGPQAYAPDDPLDAYEGALHDLAWNLSDMFQQDNPHFKRALFMAACGTPD